MQSVLDKIAESAGGRHHDRARLAEFPPCGIGVLPEDRVRIDPEVWAHLAGYLERREAIRATYQTFDGRVSEYELHPYHLLAYHGNWYTLALNTAKARVETFALSRFRQIAATGQTFTRPAEFCPETYARQAFGIVGGEEPIKVRLLFEPKLAVYITERQWHPSQKFRARPEGRVEMRLETTGRKELVRWILSWMPDVKVLGPEEPAGPNRGETAGWTAGTAMRHNGPTARCSPTPCPRTGKVSESVKRFGPDI